MGCSKVTGIGYSALQGLAHAIENSFSWNFEKVEGIAMAEGFTIGSVMLNR